ncbi:hypothetical protein UFOVP201_2 [uncultured Caudovirales phage]|uniref:Uncharacterized protein n=1 Tax=uncultured Caudovirales phage TaxID=2100421 RepID=A0A6J7WI68_9CAUD|nr:hypothetical protein UFOVP201_2 [uncultured Caudovirales phage]
MSDIPRKITSKAATIKHKFCLLLFLDGEAYLEIYSDRSADFTYSLEDWKRNTLPSLRKSNVQFFVRKQADIDQFRIIEVKM